MLYSSLHPNSNRISELWPANPLVWNSTKNYSHSEQGGMQVFGLGSPRERKRDTPFVKNFLRFVSGPL